MPHMEEFLPFVVDSAPACILVYDARATLVFKNAPAARFLARLELPLEVHDLTKRLLRAIAQQKTAEQFPGRITFSKEIGERRMVFRLVYRESDPPLVCVYFTEETVSGRFDLNALRQQHRLTRREADALRHLLDGLDNQGISEELGIAEQTVKEYVSSIYRKLGVQDRFSLLRHLVATGRP